MTIENDHNRIVRGGYTLLENQFTYAECDQFVTHLGSLEAVTVGSRCLLNHKWVCELAAEVRSRLGQHFSGIMDLVCVQCTYFHKSATTNWSVAWHQDRSIPVAERVESDLLRGWSVKEGELFVQAPESVLENMVAVRIHLDDCTDANGPLRVLAGSHQVGVVSPRGLEDVLESCQEALCIIGKGGVLIMRPLLVHASSKSTSDTPRRVLHFLLGPAQLPLGLSWRCAV